MAYMSGILDLDPRSLVVLHLVGRHGSLSAAARELGWTHPAVSQHVRLLERRLGLPLVERAGRGVRLTAQGRALARHADRVADELVKAQATAAALRRRSGRVVRVAAFPTACATFVVDAIHTLAEADPALLIEVRQAEPPEALPALRSGEVDLAVLFDVADQADLDLVEAGHEQQVVVLRRGDERAELTSVPIEALAHEVVIAGCPTCQARFVDAAHAVGIEPELHHQVTDDYVLMQAMVAAGQGVAVLPELALRAHHRDDVMARPLSPAMTRRTVLATRTGDADSTTVAAVVEALGRAIAGLGTS